MMLHEIIEIFKANYPHVKEEDIIVTIYDNTRASAYTADSKHIIYFNTPNGSSIEYTTMTEKDV